MMCPLLAPHTTTNLSCARFAWVTQTRRLSAVEDRLFQYLLSRPNQVCTPQELLDHVWSVGRTLSVVEKTINRLRYKVEEDPGRPP